MDINAVVITKKTKPSCQNTERYLVTFVSYFTSQYCSQSPQLWAQDQEPPKHSRPHCASYAERLMVFGDISSTHRKGVKKNRIYRHKITCMSDRGLRADLTSVAGLRGSPGPPPAMSVVLHVFGIRTVVKRSVLHCTFHYSTENWDLLFWRSNKSHE